MLISKNSKNHSNLLITIIMILSITMFLALKFLELSPAKINIEFIVSVLFGMALLCIILLFISRRKQIPFKTVISDFLKGITLNTRIALFFIGILVVFFYRFFLFGDQFTPANLYYAMSPANTIPADKHGALLSDPIDFFLPIKYYVKNEIFNNNRIPFWNPYSGMGYSIESDVASILGYIPNWFILLLPISVGLLACTFFEMYLCLWGMYLFLGRFGLSAISKLIGAITYTFSGTVIVWLLWPHTSVAMLAPILFYFVDRIIEEKKTRFFLVLLCIVTQMLYAGMPPYVAYFYYLLGAYTIFRSIDLKQNKKECFLNIGILFLVAIISGLISFPYTINLIASIQKTDYLSQRTNYYQSTFPIRIISQLIIPNQKNIMGHFNESAMYIGLIPLASIFVSFFAIKKNRHIFFWLIIVSSVLLITFTHLSDPFFKLIPLINTSLKTRIIILFGFAGSILNAFVFDSIKEWKIDQGPLLLGLVSLMIIAIFRYNLFQDKLGFGIVLALIVFMYIKTRILKSDNFDLISKIMDVLLFLVVLIDLFSKLISYNPYIGKYTRSLPSTDSIEYLQNQAGIDRFIALGPWTIFPNSAIRYNLYDIRAHSFSVTSPSMNHFLKDIDANAYKSKTRVSFSQIDSPYGLSVANVKYILTDRLEQPARKISITENNQNALLVTISDRLDFSQKMILPSMEVNRMDFYFDLFDASQKTNEEISITFKDNTNNQTLFIKRISLSQLAYTDHLPIKFDHLKIESGHEYELVFHLDNSSGSQIIIPLFNSSSVNPLIKPISFVINDLKVSCYMNIDFIEEHSSIVFDRSFSDGLNLYINNEALDRVFLTRNIEYVSPEEISKKLESEKELGKIFISDPIELQKSKIHGSEFANIVSYENDRIGISVNVKDKAIMVISDSYDENWKAMVNGSERTIFPVNGLFRGIVVYPGDSEIEFRFVPRLFYKGVFASLATLIVLTIGLIFGRNSKFIKSIEEKIIT